MNAIGTIIQILLLLICLIFVVKGAISLTGIIAIGIFIKLILAVILAGLITVLVMAIRHCKLVFEILKEKH